MWAVSEPRAEATVPQVKACDDAGNERGTGTRFRSGGICRSDASRGLTAGRTQGLTALKGR